jgi:MoaA/NifB/PqqE/SkfB family radical SAM enzyme
MCDIWKDNKNLKQLTEEDISGLLISLKKLGTQQVVMSGGEALLNPNFFRFCALLKKKGIKISLLSTGLTLGKNAEQILEFVNDVIVSLDGTQQTHDRIRNIPGAFDKLREGIRCIKAGNPAFRITARTVIHRLNFREWPKIIAAAKAMRLDQISFLPADVSSHAFNREVLWSDQRQQDIVPDQQEVAELKSITNHIMEERGIASPNFIAESPEKLQKIYQYYAAFHGLENFPYKKCNAPWVSAVVEADGTVRPCFFHQPLGNIREQSLDEVLNSDKSMAFRRELDMATNPTCIKCVCYLNLSPGTKLT